MGEVNRNGNYNRFGRRGSLAPTAASEASLQFTLSQQLGEGRFGRTRQTLVRATAQSARTGVRGG